MRKIMACATAMMLAGTLAFGDDARNEMKSSADLKDKDMKVLTQAPEVLQALASAPDRGIPKNLLEDADCVLVFPNVAKGAFVVGGEFGRGVATCRQPNGEMGAPSMFTIGGASIGWQVGGESTDFVLLVMDENGMDNLLRDEFKIGADASVAAGPVGRTAEASTDALLGAQMLSWSRSQGVFAGASLEGAVIKANKEANQRLYGRELTAQQIFESNPAIPAASRNFVNVATRLTSGGDSGSASLSGDTMHETDTARSGHQTGTDTWREDDASTRAANDPNRSVGMPDDQYGTRTYGNEDLDSDAVTGTIVSVSPNRLSVDTATGRRTFTINESTNQPDNLRAGQRISISHNDALVANRITLSEDYGSELPRTASYLPLAGIAGVLLLLAAYRMSLRSRHAG